MLLENIRDTDVRVALIQALIPEGLKAVNENYRKKSGIWRGESTSTARKNVRWGRQGGSVYLMDQKIPIEVPRVRNKLSNSEVPLEYYQKFKEPYNSGEQVFKLLNGISTHRYRECAGACA